MQDIILEIQDHLSKAVKRGDTGAAYTLERLKELSEKVIDLEFKLEVAEKAIEHG